MKIVPLGIVVHNNKVLLVHRRFYPVLWGPPGGFINEGEESIEAVEREVFEESGVDCSVIAKIHEFEAFNAKLIVYACKYNAGSLRCSYESKNVGWFELKDLPEPISPDLTIFKKAISVIENHQ